MIMLLFLTSCETTTTNTATNGSINAETQAASNSTTKSDNEALVDGVVQVIKGATPLIEKGLENRRYKDSVRMANKEEIWAYQIGIPFDNIDALSDELEKLKTIDGISVFENSDKDFLIIRNGDSQQQLSDSLGNFKSEIKKIDAQIKVGIINLSSKCDRKSSVKTSKERKLKRRYPEIQCYKCEH